ncbi:MAG TPA: transcriptional regulator, partial [Myxococcota bacterium]|nr:transcriptional regulator [Myxococcota bacterium]
EEELRHVERSARGQGERLVVEPARCLACDFRFRDREARHLHAPGRCPRCRSERIADPSFRLERR